MSKQKTDLQAVESHEFLDFSNPQHFINLVPDSLKEAILRIPPDLFNLSEQQLILKMYNGDPPDDLDYQLRLSFWEEYERCFETCLKMRVSKICSGCCTQPYFYRSFLASHTRVLFMITQPTVVNNKLKYNFHLAMEAMTKFLKTPIPINQKTGTPDTKIMELQFKAFEYLDQRFHGSIIQRQQIEQKNTNLNIDVNKAMEQIPKTPEAIDNEIKLLESELSGFSVLSPQNEISEISIMSPMEKVVIEAGRVTTDFERKKSER